MNISSIDSSGAPLASAATLNELPPTIPPSRHTNPFATCWTRPGALPFCFQKGQSAEQLISQLEAQRWRGEIVGPHGCGKSTLLATLIPRIEATGRVVQLFALRDGERRLPESFWCIDKVGCLGSADSESSLVKDSWWLIRDTPNSFVDDVLVVIDGYEQLGWLDRMRLRRFCRRWRAGLLITSHSRAGLPTLIELQPDLDQIHELATALCEAASATIDRGEVAASHARHGSNVREIFFDLYDRYEQARRGRRSGIRFAP